MRFGTLADWLAWQETLHSRSIDLGLGRVARVAEDMGLHGPRPFTITVGGTNGKGSCVAMLAAILRCAGYRIGTYTSPHLLRYNERICVDGAPVPDDSICSAFERVEAVRGGTSLSFFEFGTLAALDIFAAAGLDAQILEVGMGGRLDAVNIVDADAALVSSIDIDHSEWLGDSRDAIGLEKAGIFRAGRPAVVGEPNLPESVRRYAADRGIRLHRLGVEFEFEASGQFWRWSGSGSANYEQLPLPAIPGEHQLMNASAVLEVLSSIASRLPVSDAAVRRGLESVTLPGRFHLLPGPVSVLLDVAHNPQAAKMLSRQLRQSFPDRGIRAVFAVMKDKDIHGIVSSLRNQIDHWYLAPLAVTRAASVDQLQAVFSELGLADAVSGFPDAASAVSRARFDARAGDIVLVFGSFFLVSEYLATAS
jgi:dihydrofolate synthase/folylpolyglutamate synthase